MFQTLLVLHWWSSESRKKRRKRRSYVYFRLISHGILLSRRGREIKEKEKGVRKRYVRKSLLV